MSDQIFPLTYEVKSLSVRNFCVFRICQVCQGHGQQHESLAPGRPEVDGRRQEVERRRELKNILGAIRSTGIKGRDKIEI